MGSEKQSEDGMTETMELYCCQCGDVTARLTDGSEIYPHRPDLHSLPFWKCDQCGNFVGCTHKTKERTKPLGCIPTPEIREARKKIHVLLDSIWKGKLLSRADVYAAISQEIGREYHTANIRSMEEARQVYGVVQALLRRAKAGR